MTALAILLLCAPPRVSAGDDLACAVIDGAVYCWGEGNDGELGDGTTDSKALTARRVVGIDDAVDVSVGDDLVCAVHASRTVSCWGEAYEPSGPNRSRPERVRISDVASVHAIDRSACARLVDGRITCWGRAGMHDLPRLPKADRLAVRRGVGCLRTATGDVACWDFEKARPEKMTPVSKPWAKGATALAINNGGLCASIGRQLVCGMALEGGEPTRTDAPSAAIVSMEDALLCMLTGTGEVRCGVDLAPVRIPGGATDVSVGEGFACAVTGQGRVWCWGEGDDGQLGDGRGKDSKRPVEVKGIR